MRDKEGIGGIPREWAERAWVVMGQINKGEEVFDEVVERAIK